MALAPAMSVPGASDLGLGAALGSELASETEEARKKRLAAMTASSLMGPAAGASSLGLGTPGYSAMGSIGGLGGR